MSDHSFHMPDQKQETRREPEPRWTAVVAALTVAVLFYAIPQDLKLAPGWLLLVVVAILLVPTMLFRRLGNDNLNDIFGYAILSSITLAMLTPLIVLIIRLPSHKDPPVLLLRAAAALWISNILIFASWYWRLDGGGPNERDKLPFHRDGAFLFPQMMMDPELRKQMGEDTWNPGFVDYLFLAFNTSTAFSPTDVPVLSRWAKGMMIVQSLISLVTVVLVAARGVNIL